MASNRRIILGCLLFIFLGFIWVPVWVVFSSRDDVDVLLVADMTDPLEPSNGRPLPSTQGSPRDIHELPNKLMEITRLFRGRHKTTHSTATSRGKDRLEVLIPTQLPELSTDDQPTPTMIDNSTHTFTHVDNGCELMNFRQTTFRWIKIMCEVMKKQPVAVRVGLLVLVGSTSLILTLIGYKLLCPRIHRREGIEKLYDMEDSWLMFA